MVGKTYLYKKQHITIRGVMASDADQLIRIKTNGEDITLSPLTLPLFISQCLPVADEPASVAIVHQDSQISNMQEILLDSIKKIQQDKDYVVQAKAINNHVNTLLNMVKLQLQLNKNQ